MEPIEPYCDSDEEVFFGPVTLKEVKKALTLCSRTQVHVPISSTVEAGARKNPAAGRKELLHNLTYTPNIRSKKMEEWDRRKSLDVNVVKLFTEEEAPAPPPSPEKMEYNGSPFPTPCNPQKVRHSNLHHIAEEDEINKQLDIHKRESMLSKLSILTTMNDSLTEGFFKPLSEEQEETHNAQIDEEGVVQGTSFIEHEAREERINGRSILLEKMKEYQTHEQQLRSRKRGPLHKNALEDSLIELSVDDLLILNDVENDYSSEECGGSPVMQCRQVEVPICKELTGDNKSDLHFVEVPKCKELTGDSKSDLHFVEVPKCKELTGDSKSDLRFSRLVPERMEEDSSENQHEAGFSSNFLGDFERRYGKRRLNEVLASLSSEEESPERSTSASDTSTRMRPVSPEYDVNMSVDVNEVHESGCSSISNSAVVSLTDSIVEISVLEEDLNREMEQLSQDVSNISVRAENEVEALNNHVSLATEEANIEADNSLASFSDYDLSESSVIVSYENQLNNQQSSKENSPQDCEYSKMTGVSHHDSLQSKVSSSDINTEVLEVVSISCAREKSQNCSISSHTSISDCSIHEPQLSKEEYKESKGDEAICDNLQNNTSNMGGKSYVMNDEYSLISEAESESYTPNKKNTAYTAEPCISLASFDEKAAPSVDEDGGFLSVLSEAALLHASLTHHNVSVSGKQGGIDQVDFDRISVHNQSYKLDTEINSAHNQIFANVSNKRESINVSMLKSSDPNASTELTENIGENVLISSQDSNKSRMPDEGMEADFYAGETNALDDLSESDKQNLGKDASFTLSADSEKFNDTLEEIEMLLKQGCLNDADKSSSVHKSTDVATAIEPSTSNIEQSQNLSMIKSEHSLNDSESKIQKNPKLPSAFEAVHNLPKFSISPVPYIQTREKSHLPVMKKNSPPTLDKMPLPVISVTKAGPKEIESPFKVPIKPVSQTRSATPRTVKQKPMPSTPSPFKKTGYKKIISPVGMYIHNTPSPSLVTNIKPKGISPRSRATKVCTSTPISSAMQHTPEKSKVCAASKNNAENIDINNIQPILPMVSYKSAPALKLDEDEMEKLPKMNDKMKKLIDTPRPHVIRHEGRVKVEPIPQMRKFASPKQSKCTNNSFNSSDPEISVVVEKKATRTNTVGI